MSQPGRNANCPSAQFFIPAVTKTSLCRIRSAEPKNNHESIDEPGGLKVYIAPKLQSGMRKIMRSLLCVLGILSLHQASGEVISDFNDGIPDYDFLGKGSTNAIFEEADGTFSMTCLAPGWETANWARNILIEDGTTLELSLDIVDSDSNGYQAAVMFGFFNEKPDDSPMISRVTDGYYFMKIHHAIGLVKFRNTFYTPGAIAERGATFIWDQEACKQINVRLVLAVAGVGDNLEFTIRVLDLDDNLNELYSKSVTDTPGRDPSTAAGWQPYPKEDGSVFLEPFNENTHVWLGVGTPTMTQFPGTVYVDNFEFSQGGLPPSEIVLTISRAADLVWSTQLGHEYRLFRSEVDQEHFFPLSDRFVGTGGEFSFLESVGNTQQAFYKVKAIPGSLPANELLAVQQNLQSLVDERNIDQIADLFQADMVFEEVPLFVRLNKEEMKTQLTNLFNALPEYSETTEQALAGENVVVVEQVIEGTHTGEWDLGPLGIVPATSQSVSMPQVCVVDFAGDRIIRFSKYFDSMDLMMQLGLIPIPGMQSLVPSINIPDPLPTGLSPLEASFVFISRWNTSDLAGHAGMIHEDADLGVPGFGYSLTRAEYTAVQEGFMVAFPDHNMEVKRYVDLGDGWVLAEAVWAGTNTGSYFGEPATGGRVVLSGLTLNHFDEDGLVTYSHIYFDNATMLDQLGMW